MTYFILFIATMFGMGLVARIKNDIIRAAIGIPMVVSMFALGMLTLASAICAQWKPDRPDYEVLNDGNFYTTAHDMNTALSIALNTLEYNGAKMHSLNVNRQFICKKERNILILLKFNLHVTLEKFNEGQ